MNALVNMDLNNGIHYGVINQHQVLQAWTDESEPFYIYSCPYCGHELKKRSNAKMCPTCRKKLSEDDFVDLEPIEFIYKREGYHAVCGEDGDIFLLKSPYYTLCRECSPCAPNAGYLMSPDEQGLPAYCFGEDWFDDGKTPYPILKVKNWNRSLKRRLKPCI
jgi:ribosomal protein L37AE/L43A